MLFRSPGAFYAGFSVVLRTQSDGGIEAEHSSMWDYVTVLEVLFLTTLFITLIISLARPIDTRSSGIWFWAISLIYSIYTLGFLILQIYYMTDKDNTAYLVFFLIVVGCYFIPAVVNFCCRIQHRCKFLIGILFFIVSIPLYAITLQIYSFSNIHDVTWGNRRTDDNTKKALGEKEKQYKSFRFNFILMWLLINVGFAYMINYNTRTGGDDLVLIIMIYTGLVLGTKLIGIIVSYFFDWHCCHKDKKKDSNPPVIPRTDTRNFQIVIEDKENSKTQLNQ